MVVARGWVEGEMGRRAMGVVLQPCGWVPPGALLPTILARVNPLVLGTEKLVERVDLILRDLITSPKKSKQGDTRNLTSYFAVTVAGMEAMSKLIKMCSKNM